jgi:superfamily II DNA or RNA helicase
MRTKHGFWSERAKINYLDSHANESFMVMIKLIQTIAGSSVKWKKLRELLATFNRCLVFVETIQQCGEICRYTYHSKNSDQVNKENLRKFNDGEINFLATINQLNAGITFPNLNRAILLHSYASSSKAVQRISRTLNYLEGESAELHIICMNNTRDVVWTQKGLEYLGNENITWIEPK